MSGIDLTCSFSRGRAGTTRFVLDGEESRAQDRDCLTKPLCTALREFLDKARVLGFGMGGAFYLAGTAMFFACYACCCCRQHFEQHAAGQGAAQSAGKSE